MSSQPAANGKRNLNPTKVTFDEAPRKKLDARRFEDLIERLRSRGISRNAQSWCLGFSGTEGKRVLHDIVAGTSSMSAQEAYDALCKAFLPDNKAALRWLSRRLVVYWGVSLDVQTKWLGYSGNNGSRDIKNVIKGTSRTMPRDEAFKTLWGEFSATMFHCRDDDASVADKLEMLIVGLRSRGISRNAQSWCLGFSGTEGKRVLHDIVAGTSSMSAQEAYDALCKAFLSDNKAALRWLSRRLLNNGVSLDVQTKWLGYSGNNGSRDIKNVIKGTSRTMPRDEAFKTLWGEFSAIMFH